MSKRFGRKQKRAMRSALAEFGAQIGKHLNTISGLREQMHTNEQALRLVARVLGDDFVGLEPRSVHTPTLDRPIRMAPRLPLEQMMFSPGELADAVAYSVLDIEANYAKVVYYEQQVRFHFHTPDGEVAYGMSRQAWERMPADAKEHMLRGEIAASMARHLVKNKTA